jgi:predicted RNase H-like HicB family nuclease
MRHRFTLEYWQDGKWFVGRLIEVPGVFSQGTTLEDLEENIQDAYEMMISNDRPPVPESSAP